GASPTVTTFASIMSSHVNPHIIVDQHIAQPSNTAPGHLTMPGAEILRQSLRRLPYDLKLSDDCILPVRGHEENIATDCDVGGDLLSGVHYVPEVDVVTCHRTTASLSTCSRM